LGDGTRVEATFIGQQDLAGAYCAGEMASMRTLELDASDSPDDFLPLISEEELREYCAAFGTPTSATTIEQSFCVGWVLSKATFARVIAESPDVEKAIDLLADTCMAFHFAMNWDGTAAYDDDLPVLEYALFGEGIICYPLESRKWSSPSNMPYDAACPIGLDVTSGERSISVAFLTELTATRQGLYGGARDEVWFYEAYLLGVGLFDELVETSVLGEDEAILGGDTFCLILAANAEEGQSAHDGTLMAIKELGFLLGIADPHATLLGAFAAGALCDEPEYQYALELFEELAR
jgi:hypothetical protein